MNRKKLFVTVGVCTAMISVGAGSAAAAYVAGSGAKSYPVSAKVDALLENLHGKYVYQGEDGTEYVHGDFDAIRDAVLTESSSLDSVLGTVTLYESESKNTYSAGKLYMTDNGLYMALQNAPTTEPEDTAQWKRVSISALLNEMELYIATVEITKAAKTATLSSPLIKADNDVIVTYVQVPDVMPTYTQTAGELVITFADWPTADPEKITAKVSVKGGL